MASGIRDRVVIAGMGCTKFGERWDFGSEALMVEAFSGTPWVHHGTRPQRIWVASRSPAVGTTTGTCSVGSTR